MGFAVLKEPLEPRGEAKLFRAGVRTIPPMRNRPDPHEPFLRLRVQCSREVRSVIWKTVTKSFLALY